MDTKNDNASGAASAARPRRGLTALVIANVALAGVLAWVELGPVATAQPASSEAAARPRGSYTLVGGEIQTGNSNAVYVIDSANQEMVVLRWEDGRNTIGGIGYRDLRADSEMRPQR